MSEVVAIVSGGLDSTTLLHDLQAHGHQVRAVSFNYGQRHKKELNFAQQTCEKLHIRWSLIDLWASGLTDLLSSSESSLVSATAVPEGHYAEGTMKATVVPNRNMIMLSIAGGIAVAEGADHLAIGVHAGDHFIYPDCRPSFITYVDFALANGNEGFGFEIAAPMDIIMAPYINRTKADIAYRALELDVPLHETWSCYKGGAIHCGKCGTCVERLEAIDEATRRMNKDLPDVEYDLTEYEDKEFWRQAVANA